ncbi:MAG: ATP-binding cassette domain-containing protein [Chloroflexi bacterium]|nr:MAG: ATP-binding cassette domain-containing protein [Chloroflexota bacterium]
MATVVNDPSESSGSKRRRRRARREADPPEAIGNGKGNGEHREGNGAPDPNLIPVAIEAVEQPAAVEDPASPSGPLGHLPINGEEQLAAVEDPASPSGPAPQALRASSPQVGSSHLPMNGEEQPVRGSPQVGSSHLPVNGEEQHRINGEDQFRDLLGQAVGLRLDSVSREFGGRDEMHVTALRNVTLDVGPCEYVAIVGPSGCGKSTLLSLMGGLDRPTSGHVYGAGLPLGELPDRDLSDYRLQRVSTIFQTFNLIPSMTVEDNVALPLTLAGVELEERRRRARHLLALVGLENRARTRAGRLSGGEQQKVAVARALANRPGLILADEPTGSLDSTAGEGVLSLLDDLNRRGATVVLVTHDPEVARRARRVIRMIDGRAIELEAGKPTVRSQEPVDPPARMHWRDTLKVGLGSAGRRPLRTTLTTTGVAIGIAALSLIIALAGGLQQALDAPALATSQVHQVAVYPVADARTPAFDAPTLATLARLANVRAAWGQVAMSGTFGAPGATPSAKNAAGVLVSLPPLGASSSVPSLTAGRMPSTDVASEVLLTDSEAVALGFRSPTQAVGTHVGFVANSGGLASGLTANQVTTPVPMNVLVVGIVSTDYMPAGAPGALAPNAFMRAYWSALSGPNRWTGGEFASITLLADSGLTVDSLRRHVEALGFQTQTFGDQFRNFEDLLGKLKVALLGLAIIALLLACLGIANTMYTAVLERTKEIGVLKALGARSRDVMLLFLAEAAGIGLAGGLVGALVAVGLARLGNAAVDRLTQSVSSTGFDVFRSDLPVVLMAVVLAALLSTVSGLLPALRAAWQDPARALRHE